MSQTNEAGRLQNRAGQTCTGQCQMPTVTPQALTRTVQDFLSEAAGAVVLENGAAAFDLAQSKYSISGESNRCLLHLWSAERNSVRRVLGSRSQEWHVAARGPATGPGAPVQTRNMPGTRSPFANASGEWPGIAYEQKLRRTLDRHFPEFKVTKLTTGVDLEKSFGPVYARGLMRHGRSAFALLGVNAQETQSIHRRRADLRHFVARRLPQRAGLQTYSWKA